jgi:SAM-dependent methyltransferase
MQHPDHYMPGYTPRIVHFMERRTAETHAQFFLLHLRPGMKLLDCGCGPGTITRGLAARGAPGEVVGIDLEESQLEIGRKDPEHPQNLTYVKAGVYQLPFPDAHFDAVFSHALFEHIAEPVAALREIKRVLKPGGVAGLCSPDWDGFIFAPPDPEIDAAAALFRRIQEANGGNTTAGRRLGVWMGEAGWKDIKMAARYECQDDLGLMADFLYDRLERAPKQDDIFGRGWCDEASLKRMLHELRQWEKRKDGLFGLTWVSAVGRA